MGSDPGDGWPSKGEYYDEDSGEWLHERDKPKKEQHVCTVKVFWRPKHKNELVTRTFCHPFDCDAKEGYYELEEDAAQLAWILQDPKSFAKECIAPNVTENDVENIREIIFAMFDAFNGDDDILADLASIRARLYGEDGIDRKRARFVKHVRACAITAQKNLPAWKDNRDAWHDRRVTELISIAADRFSAAFANLDPVMVKKDVLSIDPDSKGGKRGPAWLAARMIDAANAGDDFDFPRASGADKGYFDYVKNTLQTAKTPGRSKPKSSAKTTQKRKTTAK